MQAKVTAVNNNPDNITTFKKWEMWKEGEDLNGKGNFTITAEYAEKFRRYIDYFGANTLCENGTGDESHRCEASAWSQLGRFDVSLRTQHHELLPDG